MICSKPFVKTPVGVQPHHVLNPHNRAGAMPFGCGVCINCRITLGQIWKHRIILEAKEQENVFVTLTFDNKKLPEDLNVTKRDVQKFHKRLRDRIGAYRYFSIGEYGAEVPRYRNLAANHVPFRPHYHHVLFGVDETKHRDIYQAWNQVKGNIEIRKTKKGKKYLYHPDEVGNIEVSPLNEFRAGYIAGYTTSKLYKNKYCMEEYNREVEFALMSKMDGGLGLTQTLKAGDAILKDPNFDVNAQIIDSFQYGKKKLPLGRYLTFKLADYIGTPPELFEARNEKREIEHFETYIFGNKSSYSNYYESMVEKNGPDRRARANRWKTKYQRTKTF